MFTSVFYIVCVSICVCASVCINIYIYVCQCVMYIVSVFNVCELECRIDKFTQKYING